MSKRELAAAVLKRSGVLSILEMLRSKPGILIVNHHRVGDASTARFDRDVFSASAEAFEMQLKYFKRYFPIVAGEELENLVSGKTPLKRTYIAITFDDGYINDFRVSYPILKANNCAGTFFLVPQYVGTSYVPWWDEIAYLVRNSPRSQITLHSPVATTISLTGNREDAIRSVLRHYKRPDNHDGERILNELREQTGCAIPPTGRRFITWEEAREMREAGMAIGSHTQSGTASSVRCRQTLSNGSCVNPERTSKTPSAERSPPSPIRSASVEPSTRPPNPSLDPWATECASRFTAGSTPQPICSP